ncbi:MAG: methyl-accepting chemotaxis protein [Verrucomicrobiae bacterium]|nr:methyl-accepting chemotaxis protein [Verrucomicrobiae bacterium]
MQNWTIGKRITVGFALVLAIMCVLGIATYSRLKIVQNEVTTITSDNIPSLAQLSEAQTANTESRLLTYKHIGSPDGADMDKLEAKINSNADMIGKNLAAFEKMASPQAKALLEQALSCREKYKTVRGEILALSRAATNAEISARVYQKARAELDPVALNFADALTKCQEQENKESQESSASVFSAVNKANLGLLVGLSAALILGAGLAFIIIRSTTRVLRTVSASLNDGSNQVASAAGQVSSASQSLAEGSGEQAASIEESSASLEELSSMTKRNSENAQKANDLAKQARQAADKGAGDMQSMSAAMDAIKVSSDDIAKIIKTIDEIAFQTNILALNAAVEAARAGEAGMGFAVVADEVRNLAQRSAQAAKETAAKIEGAIVKTGQGVEISGKVVQALNDIVTKVRQVDELVTEVAGASREQTQGITQISTAVAQMDKVTQGNAANAEESAAAAEELNAQAATMKQSVAELLLLVGGQNGTAMTRPAAPVNRGNGFKPAVAKTNGSVTANRNGNGNGQAQAPVLAAGNRQSEIPMDGDFKDF